ncbi:MAG: PH domain-containing protein [Oligoflexia bacterium]|nr:PH domain-containing protein [Oligoflexia bacterium]
MPSSEPAYSMNEPLASATKHENLVIYRSALSELVSIVSVIALTILSVYLSVLFPWSVEHVNVGPLAIPIPLFGLLPLIILFRLLHNLYNYRYILCDEYVLEVRGLWSLAAKSVRINYIHIRGIEIDESLVQRILGLGDVSILGVIGNQGEPCLTMKGLRNPRHVKDLIQDRVNQQIQGMRIVPIQG